MTLFCRCQLGREGFGFRNRFFNRGSILDDYGWGGRCAGRKLVDEDSARVCKVCEPPWQHQCDPSERV
jgi:hypothetical protein